MGKESRSVKALKAYVDTKYANSAMTNNSAIVDDSDNQLVKFTKVSSAINEVNVSNNSAGNSPIIAVTGDDTNIGLVVNQKAAAPITLGTTGCTGLKLGVDQPILDSAGNKQIKFVKTSSAVNEVTVTNAATGGAVSVSATGGDTDIDLTLAPKGAGFVNATKLNRVYSQASHDYGAAVVDWTLSATELKAETLIVTNASGAANIIAPSTAGKRYTVVNNSGQAITIKKAAGTGITIADTKVAQVEYVGSDYIRLTADV